MTLTHDFYLITKVNDPTSFVKLGINLHDFIIDKVQIIDPIILYIIDTLEWIPTKNPAKAGLSNGNGLYYHGVTLFDKESSNKLKKIFSSWRSLFENAPVTIKIHNKIDENDENPLVKFNRDELLYQFDKIISFAEKIGEDKYYLYHQGV